MQWLKGYQSAVMVTCTSVGEMVIIEELDQLIELIQNWQRKWGLNKLFWGLCMVGAGSKSPTNLTLDV